MLGFRRRRRFRGSARESNEGTWGGRRFRYDDKPEPNCTAHEFLCFMAEYWIREYHIDGWRLDEFKGINNWDFIRLFRERSWKAHPQDRPSIVIAEDSGRDVRIVFDREKTSKVVDAMWSFNFHDDIRDLIRNRLSTSMGDPSRTERVKGMLAGWEMKRSDGSQYRPGYNDLSQMVNYATSHDVQNSPRLLPWLLNDFIGEAGIVCDITGKSQALFTGDLDWLETTYEQVVDIAFSAWALTLTSAGIPMVLAGEEFLDVHDVDANDWRQKMSDPTDWGRAKHPRRTAFLRRVRDLVRLRTSKPALQRNEIECLHFSPNFDANEADGGDRSFAYCRRGGAPLGSAGQVVVVANLCKQPLARRFATDDERSRRASRRRDESGRRVLGGRALRRPSRAFCAHSSNWWTE